MRLNFVRPPEPHSTGRPVAWSRRNNSQRVALTAVASLSGALAWRWIRRQDLRLLLQEVLDGPVALAAVARLARQGEIRDAVGPALAPRDDVLDLERHVGLVAVRARAVVLLEQVLPHLVAGERALLVLDAGDLGVLDLLEVEPDQLLRRRGDRAEPEEPADPGQHVATRLASDGGSQPSGRVRLSNRGLRYRVLRLCGALGVPPGRRAPP